VYSGPTKDVYRDALDKLGNFKQANGLMVRSWLVVVGMMPTNSVIVILT
jgi:hypothetical protein